MGYRGRFVVAAAAVVLAAGALAALSPATARAGPPVQGRVITHSLPSGLRAWLRARAGAGQVLARSGHGKFRDPVAPVVDVGRNPVAVAVNPATGTVYIGNGNGQTMSVVNGATCNATEHRGCTQKPPGVPAGPGPVDAVVDRATDTVYVTDAGSNTVSVINGNACNAHHIAGCSATPPTVTVGNSPDGVAIDEATRTVYVANGASGTVSVINAATCNATHHSGCGQKPPTVWVGGGPGVLTVNQATGTVYVPNSSDGTISVINGAACNATHHAGCHQVPPTISVGPSPFATAVDQATDTIYTTSATLGTATSRGAVYVINGAICDSQVTTGCGQSPASVTVGSIPVGVAYDRSSNDVFALSEEDATVSIFGAAACNATDTSGCDKPVRTLGVGHNSGYLDVNPATHTLYVTNQNDSTVSVLDTRSCTPHRRSGCRIAALATAVGLAPQGIAADAATGTVYVGNRTDASLSVISSAACNAHHRSGCARRWPTVATGPFPQAVAVDPATGAIYTANCNEEARCTGHTVSVINGARCNARVTSGCGRAPATVNVGSGPIGLAVNPVTDTIYVASVHAGTVSVINGATCNGTSHSGCGNTPPAIKVGGIPFAVAVDQATDTIYVVNGAGRGKVSVINGATCNGTSHSGCGNTPPAFTTNRPSDVAVAQATSTLYVASANTTTVSVINAATCNPANLSGCHHAAALTANSPATNLGIDQRTGTVFADFQPHGSEIFVLNGGKCNAHITSGCHRAPAVVPVGGWPSGLADIPATHTLYVTDNVDATASFFGFGPRSVYP